MSHETVAFHKGKKNWTVSQIEIPEESTPVPKIGDRLTGSLFIIDRREFARDCLAFALKAARNNRPVEVFASVNELPQQATQLFAPSLILFCHHVSEHNSALLEEELQALRGYMRTTPVVLLSDVDDASVIARALQSGVRGHISANLPLRLAMQAIEIVEAGGTYLSTESYSALEHQRNKVPAAWEGIEKSLTTRQTTVLLALRQGKANKVIAYELNMRESTVKVHVRNIMKKLNARNRTEVSYKTNGMFMNVATES